MIVVDRCDDGFHEHGGTGGAWRVDEYLGGSGMWQVDKQWDVNTRPVASLWILRYEAKIQCFTEISGSVGEKTQDLWICIQELKHRGRNKKKETHIARMGAGKNGGHWSAHSANLDVTDSKFFTWKYLSLRPLQPTSDNWEIGVQIPVMYTKGVFSKRLSNLPSECPVAPFVSGSLVQRIPFVFLPLKEQIINPSAEISFAARWADLLPSSGAAPVAYQDWGTKLNNEELILAKRHLKDGFTLRGLCADSAPAVSCRHHALTVLVTKATGDDNSRLVLSAIIQYYTSVQSPLVGRSLRRSGEEHYCSERTADRDLVVLLLLFRRVTREFGLFCYYCFAEW
uniref:Uncharacterized protein n=1 Tax=Timema tahoe TaxID=61484 RepID=A0A7R9IGR9_9NEOP|nr:unnamed protein product [Timema tahoe]